jgi:hypothetical protein
VAKNRVRLPERHRVPPRQPHLPLGGRVKGDQDGDDHGDGIADEAQLVRAEGDFHPLARDEQRAGGAHRLQRQAEVHGQPDGRNREHRREQQRLRPQDGGVDRLIADFAEPEPVGVEGNERRPRHEDQQERGDGERDRSAQHQAYRARAD